MEYEENRVSRVKRLRNSLKEIEDEILVEKSKKQQDKESDREQILTRIIEQKD